jgi:TRAP-type C4-dicarboxylate transport system substrate-binding protein
MTITLTRRRFGTSFAAAGLVTAFPAVFAQASEIKLKYGTAFPADHPGTLRIKEAAEALKKDTGGKVDLQVYPASQLGSEPDMISQTRAGAVGLIWAPGPNLQTQVATAGHNGVALALKG